MSANAVTLNDITSADWSLTLDTPGQPGSGIGQVVQGTADVNQCIQIILTTPKQSDPLRPTFGAELWQYIDNPIDAAIPAIVREVTQAITLWEPRVTLISVMATPVLDGSVQSGAHFNVAITWRLKLSMQAPKTPPFAPVQVTNISLSTLSL